MFGARRMIEEQMLDEAARGAVAQSHLVQPTIKVRWHGNGPPLRLGALRLQPLPPAYVANSGGRFFGNAGFLDHKSWSYLVILCHTRQEKIFCR